MNSYNGFSPTQRMKALRWLKVEYAAGRRHPPVRCDVCGQTDGHIEAHSEDYSEPFGDNIGRWGLCYRCHMILHCRFRSPEAFRQYQEILASGKRFVAVRSRAWGAFAKQHLASGQCSAPVEVVHASLKPPAGFALLLVEGRAAREKSTGQTDMF